MGNLTRDPELRMTPQGVAICKFSIAVSRQAKAADGTPREETAFIDIDSFGKQAETINRYMTKGRPILIEGRLRLDQWESQSGEKRSKLCVVLEGFQFVGARGDDDASVPGQGIGRGVPIGEVAAQREPAMGMVEDLSGSRLKKSKPPVLDTAMDEDVPF
jgi:single-strand DNA-binding protein